MKIKNILFLFSGCMIINTIFAMEKENMSEKEFIDKQTKLIKKYPYRSKDDKLFEEEAHQLFTQAINSGIQPSTIVAFKHDYDIIGYAIDKKDKNLLITCFEKGYSPDSLVLYKDKKIPALAVVPFDFWPLFKKYKANFNIMLKDNRYRTLLHKFIPTNDNHEIQWLLKETNMDINQPDGDGNTIGHIFVNNALYGNEKEDKEVFNLLKSYDIDPFQKNNDNKTPKEIAQKNLLASQTGMIRYQSTFPQMLSLWEDYEKEYAQNIHKKAKTRCYCEIFVDLKNPCLLSEDFTTDQIQDAYNFFPQDSRIGSFCKQHPANPDCIILAKHYICFNNVDRITEKIKTIQSQINALEKEEKIVDKALNDSDKLSKEEKLNLLEPETREKYNKRAQLSAKEQFDLNEVIRTEQEKKLGITDLENQHDSIKDQLNQLESEFKIIRSQRDQADEKIYGYYSALDFAICSGKSAYHRAVKNLLAMIPDEQEKYIEAACINEGLHNAYNNKKQSS
ncbi:MAG TPA: hypothetical protein VKU36_05455 [Candidatus Babeliales bacterium]|nr:hypothetical protein [Candidatus Babeliales bacterium]